MSCSDKVASWSVLGLQGALGSQIFAPLYISSIIIGEVEANVQAIVAEDCERALWQRIGDLEGRILARHPLILRLTWSCRTPQWLLRKPSLHTVLVFAIHPFSNLHLPFDFSIRVLQ